MPGSASVSPTAASKIEAFGAAAARSAKLLRTAHKSLFAFDSWHDIFVDGVTYLPPMIRHCRAGRNKRLRGGRCWGATANGRGCAHDATGEIAGTVDGGNSRLHTPYHRRRRRQQNRAASGGAAATGRGAGSGCPAGTAAAGAATGTARDA